ncbi:MAG: hypothetical protein KAG89_20345 [Fulvimarina manganoxydans]|uniref:hypothetical protein n=1 Tax=Fulvimarina manganoxydans TaxID=937218 RepID=UPI00235422DF|nr:hypothetical protein [Fulvimarina manganoxydans]MCK5934510.1 hypothetical protein [Fulvimarina manganoxydans]
MESLLAELPEWARSLFYLSVAIGGAILFLHRRNQPAKAEGGEPTSTGLRLDAAFLDRRQIETAQQGLADQAEAIRAQTEAIREQTRAIHALEKEIEEHRRELGRRR